MGALVTGYLGQPGSGKTYVMSADAERWRRRNPDRPIFSTYELRLPGVYSLDPPGDIWSEVVHILDARDGLLIIDEAAQFFDSRLFGKTPADMLSRLQQVRKYGLELWWSTQHLEYLDKRLRLLTTQSYHCGSFARAPWPMAGFFVSLRSGVNGKAMGFRYVRRSRSRDALYDTLKVVQGAAYYQERNAARAR